MKEDINILDELNKGASMGMTAIKYTLEKVKEGDLKQVLSVEYNKYRKISNEINDLYSEYSKKEPHETSTMEKAMTWYGIQMKTLNDDSDSKIVELLLQGTNMGIIEGRKILNNKIMDKKIKKIAEEYVRMQEESIEVLKEYL